MDQKSKSWVRLSQLWACKTQKDEGAPAQPGALGGEILRSYQILLSCWTPGLISASHRWSTPGYLPLHATLLAVPCWQPAYFPLSTNGSLSQKRKESEKFLAMCYSRTSLLQQAPFQMAIPTLWEDRSQRTERCDWRWPSLCFLGSRWTRKYACRESLLWGSEEAKVLYFGNREQPSSQSCPPSSLPPRISSPPAGKWRVSQIWGTSGWWWRNSWRTNSVLEPWVSECQRQLFPRAETKPGPHPFEHPLCTRAWSSWWMEVTSEEGERRGKEGTQMWICHSLLSQHTHIHTPALWPHGPCLESKSPPCNQVVMNWSSSHLNLSHSKGHRDFKDMIIRPLQGSWWQDRGLHWSLGHRGLGQGEGWALLILCVVIFLGRSSFRGFTGWVWLYLLFTFF